MPAGQCDVLVLRLLLLEEAVDQLVLLRYHVAMRYHVAGEKGAGSVYLRKAECSLMQVEPVSDIRRELCNMVSALLLFKRFENLLKQVRP